MEVISLSIVAGGKASALVVSVVVLFFILYGVLENLFLASLWRGSLWI